MKVELAVAIMNQQNANAEIVCTILLDIF